MMRKAITTLIATLGLTSSTLYAGSANSSFPLVEVGGGFGYARGEMSSPQEDNQVVPLFLHFGFELNKLFGWNEMKGQFQAVVEPFLNPVIDPVSGIETGVTLYLYYSHPIGESWRWYTEIGSGPMYLSIRTLEQDEAGFNFLNQLGTGFQYFVREDLSLGFGYRWRHISHAGIRGKPNSGINTSMAVIRLTKHL